MIYRCRTVKPKESAWFEVEADEPGLAANDFHCTHDHSIKQYKHVVENDDTRFIVCFARIEVEGHGVFTSRVFEYGIWRKGGVKRRDEPSLADLAEQLEWTGDPKELIVEGWEGEETMDEASRRHWGTNG